MNTKTTPAGDFPVKNQELSIQYGSKVYSICSKEQMAYIVMKSKEIVAAKAYESGEKLTQQEFEARIDAEVKNSGFATLDEVLAMMTPKERQAWQDNYRFAPITRQKR